MSRAVALNVELLAQAVSNVEWAWMENEGRFPAPDPRTYEKGLRTQLHGMTEDERQAGPMSNPKIAAEYARLLAPPAEPPETEPTNPVLTAPDLVGPASEPAP